MGEGGASGRSGVVTTGAVVAGGGAGAVVAGGSGVVVAMGSYIWPVATDALAMVMAAAAMMARGFNTGHTVSQPRAATLHRGCGMPCDDPGMGLAMSGFVLPAATGFFASIGEWAAEYGYITIFLVVAGDGIFPILPGETSIVAGAVFAAEGALSLWGVVLVGAVGAVVGDSLAYWAGRAGGPWIRGTLVRMVGEKRTRTAEGMVRRQGPALVFVGRFLPGIRIGINLACGAGQMSYPRFLMFDAAGALLWSLQAALIGYFAGKTFANQVWVALVVAIGVAIVVGFIVLLRERRMVAQEEALEAAEARAEAIAQGEPMIPGDGNVPPDPGATAPKETA
jgi:membrane protein DedA with SNARE-associated domain